MAIKNDKFIHIQKSKQCSPNGCHLKVFEIFVEESYLL